MFRRRERSYFRCLLAMGALFARGLTEFRHLEPVSYYALLLRSERPGEVVARRPATAYQAELDSADAIVDQGHIVGNLGDGVVGSDFECCSEILGDDDSSDGDAEDACADGVAEVPLAEVPVPLPRSPSSSSSSPSRPPSEGFVCSDAEEVAEDMPALVLPVLFDGVRFSSDVFEHLTDPARSHERMVVVCSTHPACRKRRGVGALQTSRHGQWEPVAFLLAWSRMGASFAETGPHVHASPSAAQVFECYTELHALLGRRA